MSAPTEEPGRSPFARPSDGEPTDPAGWTRPSETVSPDPVRTGQVDRAGAPAPAAFVPVPVTPAGYGPDPYAPAPYAPDPYGPAPHAPASYAPGGYAGEPASGFASPSAQVTQPLPAEPPKPPVQGGTGWPATFVGGQPGTAEAPADGSFPSAYAGSIPPGSPPRGPEWSYDPRPGLPAPVAPPRRHRLLAALVVLGICAALLAGVLGGIVGSSLEDRLDGSGGNESRVELPPVVAQQRERPVGSVAQVAAAVLPSVVSLQVRNGQDGNTGSGFVVQDDGYVLTNNHVVAAATDGGSISVLFPDGKRLDATIVGRDESYDLAVVKVDRSGLKPLEFADSGEVLVGDEVVAVGSPLGLDSTVTSGIVSALNRPVVTGENQPTAFINAIQTDAAINPGNSGGPLVDLSGRVVGINSAIARAPGLTSTAGNIGLGFAIPSNQAHRTAQQLIDDGKATHPVIGVLLARDETRDGAHVSTKTNPDGEDPITKDGPADKAGIKPGDVVVAFEGRPIASSDELIVAIRSRVPGDTVTVRVRRDGKEQDLKVTLEAGD